MEQRRPNYLIFARFPEYGRAKTRLIPTLGIRDTSELYEAMLTDTIRAALTRDAAICICVHPPEKIGAFEQWLNARDLQSPLIRLAPQVGENLGDKMYHAFRMAADRDAFPAIIMGTDSPTIPKETFEAAEFHLTRYEHSAVIGKTLDGGFYLLGLSILDASFFLGNDYSHNTVFSTTVERLKSRVSRLLLLPEWYDVDDTTGLAQLEQELLRSTASVQSATQRWLQSRRQPPDRNNDDERI